MFANQTKILLVLSQDVLDRARVLAGRATATLKLPVSLQIVLRALIGEGLKRNGQPTLLASIAAQAKAVRHRRRLTHRRAELEERTATGRRGRPPNAEDQRLSRETR